jgi:CheY-like chemotaxis protein
MIEPEPPAVDDGTRMSGARAEFVASLGRRIAALREALAELEDDRRAAARRDTLLRRIHAMGAASRVLGFDAVADTLAGAERALQRGGDDEVAVSALAEVSRALDQLPALAWGAGVQVRGPASRPEPELAGCGAPLGVLVFGAAALGDALEGEPGSTPIETERTEDPAKAPGLARTLGPDIIVIDADRHGARELVATLAADPLIEPVPLIVVGSFEHPQAASSYVAQGAVRVLPKPVSPDTLRRTVLAAARRVRARMVTEPLGDISVEQLTSRIATEIRRGLMDAAEPGSQRVSVPLGAGTEVLAAVWGAVARIRELVVVASGGGVRFDAAGPEGAIPIASWAGGERRTLGRDPEGVRLANRRAIVVDDDPAVVWFISGLLRSAGMEVYEAHDGATALELAFEQYPDIIVSDVLMPGLDGLSLCREIKRDVGVRDVPVVLLSWKEDLLQRLRELGADADGYLRKEATGSVVLRKVAELLQPRARIEARLANGGEVRGRLEGLTVRLVLELASRAQPSCRVTLRDAVYLYELELRDAQLRCATRTCTDGSFERGDKVLAAALGVSEGRFVVTPSNAPVRADSSGSLQEVLREPIRRARSAQRALASEALARVDRIELDLAGFAQYLAATPGPASELIERLAAGESPRALAASGEVPVRLLEAVLSDAIRRGVVLRVISGAEPPPKPQVQAAAREAEQERLFTFDLGASVDPDSVDAGWSDAAPIVQAAPVLAPKLPEPKPLQAKPPEPPKPKPREPKPVPPAAASLPLTRKLPPAPPRLPLSSQLTPAPPPVEPDAAPDGASTDPGVGPSVAFAEAPEPPAPSSEPKIELAPRDEPEMVVELTDSDDLAELGADAWGEYEAAPPQPESDEEEPMPVADTLPMQKRIEFPRGPRAEPRREAAPSEPPELVPLAPIERERPMSLGRIALVTILAAGASFALVRWAVSPAEETAPTAATAPATAAVKPTPKPAASSEGLVREELELPQGVAVPAGMGLLELDTGGKHAIYVDGTFMGLGPRRRIPTEAGKRELKLRLGGSETTQSVEVRAAKTTRLTARAAGP